MRTDNKIAQKTDKQSQDESGRACITAQVRVEGERALWSHPLCG